MVFFRSLVYVLILAFSARISFNIPYSQINITAQTLAVVSLPFLFSSKVSILSILAYLLLGILGLPVFSEGNAGWQYFLGPSLGYFVGFVLATILIVQKPFESWRNASGSILVLQSAATIVILACGTFFLMRDLSPQQAFYAGFTPFLLGGAIKVFLGTSIVCLILKKYQTNKGY